MWEKMLRDEIKAVQVDHPGTVASIYSVPNRLETDLAASRQTT